jgi:hypothetical protein
VIAATDIKALPEHERWLLASAHIGPNTRAARLALAALRSKERDRDEAVSWLSEIAESDGRDSGHAARVLEVVS